MMNFTPHLYFAQNRSALFGTEIPNPVSTDFSYFEPVSDAPKLHSFRNYLNSERLTFRKCIDEKNAYLWLNIV